MAGAKTEQVPTATSAADGGGVFHRKLRVTSEYDSASSVFLHKLSCKTLDKFAKLKLSFCNDCKGEVSEPQISFKSKCFSLLYDVERKSVGLKASFKIAPGGCRHEVAYMPNASFKFPPLGKVPLKGKEAEVGNEEEPNIIYIKSRLFIARLTRKNLDLRCTFKNGKLTYIPRISFPSNALSCAVKWSFTPRNKLSYWYHSDSENWRAVYKHKFGEDYKFKAGYDSQVRAGCASIWVGDEDGKTKEAPMKMKVQIMLQVPQDDIKSSALMFRVKKRWDIKTKGKGQKKFPNY